MRSLEEILDHFSREANKQELADMKREETFHGGLHVLSRYAREHFGMHGSRFDATTKHSLASWDSKYIHTLDDLWLFLICRVDAGLPHGPRDCEGTESESSTDQSTIDEDYRLNEIGRKREIECFGTIKPGTGKVATLLRRRIAYFSMGHAGYAAKVFNGKVHFVKRHIMPYLRRVLKSFKELDIPLFKIGWDMSHVPQRGHNNYILSTICMNGDVEMIDWVVSLMHSGDIKISKSSEIKSCVPSHLVDEDDEGMCLTKPIRRSYFREKKFLYSRHTDDLYWIPCDSNTAMKVVIRRGSRFNSFKRVNIRQVHGRLRNCKVESIYKYFD